jgi:hypothetical protein
MREWAVCFDIEVSFSMDCEIILWHTRKNQKGNRLFNGGPAKPNWRCRAILYLHL